VQNVSCTTSTQAVPHAGAVAAALKTATFVTLNIQLPSKSVLTCSACFCPQAQPRCYGSLGVMSGPLLAGLTGAYVNAINAGAVPTIATAWQVNMFTP
jgi:hypothetical protein